MKFENDKLIEVAQKVFADECVGIKQVASRVGSEFIHALKIITKCKGKVIITGIGKSGHIANKIAATLASTGTPAFFVHLAEALHGDLGMVGRDDVVIMISYSGNADEIDIILPLLKRKQIAVIGMTGNLHSRLAKNCDCVLNIEVDHEACPLDLAPTTSTTVALVLGDALSVCLLTLRNFKPEDFALSHPGGTLGRRLLTFVKDIMHTGDALPVVSEDCNLRDIVIEITAKSLGMVGVVDVESKIVGVITDGDLRRYLEHPMVNLHNTIAKEVMSSKPKVLDQNLLAVEAIRLMEHYKITGFLVKNDNNELVGAFNLHDLFKAKIL